MDFVIDSGHCDISLDNADLLNNLGSKLSHLEPSQRCMYPHSRHVFDGGGYNDEFPCVEYTIDSVKPTERIKCDDGFQVNLKQYNLNVCGYNPCTHVVGQCQVSSNDAIIRCVLEYTILCRNK